ncbi:S66 peptidase family protein [Paenibacillus sp. MBLB4367]|uniref:S66 family peptidase n=1 Tax=Paenibacillus sp. MBLB4367 TaxID=3384767 RepID=UPI0039080B79
MPAKLKPWDEIRIVAPSKSMSRLVPEHIALAKQRLEQLGLRVSFGKHASDSDAFDSSPIEARIADLHEAFRDPNVKGILAVLGGENSNQLLRHLDYDLIRDNPKMFCGYSDITALGNAMYAKSGLVSYSGPNFSSFAMPEGLSYTRESFVRCVMQEAPFEIRPASTWSDDPWYRSDAPRTFIPNGGWTVIQPGEAAGTIIGGNLCTLNLLQGTEFMPSLDGAVLFLEDDYIVSPETFDRDLQSLIHQPSFDGVKGIVIGRFQIGSRMTPDKLAAIIRSKKELSGIPVIADVDFGHTTPQITFPIGGTAALSASEEPDGTKLTVIDH